MVCQQNGYPGIRQRLAPASLITKRDRHLDRLLSSIAPTCMSAPLAGPLPPSASGQRSCTARAEPERPVGTLATGHDAAVFGWDAMPVPAPPAAAQNDASRCAGSRGRTYLPRERRRARRVDRPPLSSRARGGTVAACFPVVHYTTSSFDRLDINLSRKIPTGLISVSSYSFRFQKRRGSM